MAYADDPRLAHAVADDARVAAGVQQRVLDAARAQHRSRVLDDVALRDAAQVDAHAVRLEEDGAASTVEHDVPIIDGADALLDLSIRRPLPSAEVVQIADAVVGDIESAATRDRELERTL